MEGHGIRMMAEVFGGMMNMIIGCLVLPLQKGGSNGYAYLDNDGRCLPKIPNQKWTLWDGSNWNDAGYKDVKVRCGYKPKGK